MKSGRTEEIFVWHALPRRRHRKLEVCFCVIDMCPPDETDFIADETTDSLQPEFFKCNDAAFKDLQAQCPINVCPKFCLDKFIKVTYQNTIIETSRARTINTHYATICHLLRVGPQSVAGDGAQDWHHSLSSESCWQRPRLRRQKRSQ